MQVWDNMDPNELERLEYQESDWEPRAQERRATHNMLHTLTVGNKFLQT